VAELPSDQRERGPPPVACPCLGPSRADLAGPWAFTQPENPGSGASRDRRCSGTWSGSNVAKWNSPVQCDL
jgi:hypothetical protein